MSVPHQVGQLVMHPLSEVISFTRYSLSNSNERLREKKEVT